MSAPSVLHRPDKPDNRPAAALPQPPMRRFLFAPVLGAALLAVAVLGTLPAEAGERQRTVTRSGQGGTVERSAEVTRTPGSREAHRERGRPPVSGEEVRRGQPARAADQVAQQQAAGLGER